VKHEIKVQRSLALDGVPNTPKSGHGRTVDLAPHVAKTLLRLRMGRADRMKRNGWTEMPPWVFCTQAAEPFDQQRVRYLFRKVLKRAKLPSHFSPHSLRHSFASLLLAEGEAPQWIQQQLGHASISLTVDTYGRWLPKHPIRGGVTMLETLLDGRNGSRLVTESSRTALKRRPRGRIPSYPYSAPYEELKLKAR
jgi:integrase